MPINRTPIVENLFMYNKQKDRDVSKNKFYPSNIRK